MIVLLWGKIRHKGKKENICGLKTAFKKPLVLNLIYNTVTLEPPVSLS